MGDEIETLVSAAFLFAIARAKIIIIPGSTALSLSRALAERMAPDTTDLEPERRATSRALLEDGRDRSSSRSGHGRELLHQAIGRHLLPD